MPNLVENCISRPQIDCMPARRWERLHLGDTGKLYQKVPLKFFAWLTGINLKRTFISTEDFRKLVATAKYLHVQLLNVECCVKISDLAIFKAKVYLGRLRSINISFNEQLTVLSVACLCSYSSVRGIRWRGLKLEERDLLFLVKTFLRLGNGQTDTLEGGSFLMRWTLFLIYFLKIFDEHLQFVNIS